MCVCVCWIDPGPPVPLTQFGPLYYTNIGRQFELYYNANDYDSANDMTFVWLKGTKVIDMKTTRITVEKSDPRLIIEKLEPN